ncbi:hypothetical protein ES702_06949 [subsurface metagenome]
MRKKKMIRFLEYLVHELKLVSMYKDELKNKRFKKLGAEINLKIDELKSPNKLYQRITSYGLRVIEKKGSVSQVIKYRDQIEQEKERKKKSTEFK